MEPKFIGETMSETIAKLWRDQYGTEPPEWITTNPTTEAVPTGAASDFKDHQ